MRVDLFDLAQDGSRMGDQIVLHPQKRLGNNLERMPGEEIKVLMNASGQSIFDRDYGEIRLFVGHSIRIRLQR